MRPETTPYAQRLALFVPVLAALGAFVGAAQAAPPAASASQDLPETTTFVGPLPGPAIPESYRYLDIVIEGSLEASLVRATERRLGAQLAQVSKRVIVWWLDVRRDLRRGDELELVYEIRADQEPLVHAIWLKSGKLDGTRSAVRYRAQGARFARWVDPEGVEVERRLRGGPIESYEQVTSLLRDGRRHRGVDFKAPVGEPIVAPFAGRVTRRNWSWRRNGNCLEIESDRGATRALLLHLDRIAPGIRPGTSVRKGQVLARSGNTGRSTAPHLHYQLERGDRVLDPFRFHNTWRARLSEEETRRAGERLRALAQLRTGSI